MISMIQGRSVLKISGSDSTKFLQNLLTNDVSGLTSEKSQARSFFSDEAMEAIYSMMLSPQGRFLFDIFVVNLEDGYLLDIFSDTRDLLHKKLTLYKINLDVQIEYLSDANVAYSPDLIEGEICYKDPRYEKLGYRVIFMSSGTVFHESKDYYLADKYQYTIPDGGIDLIYDKAMPQEYGAEELGAISYTKGCYVGQEFISRTKSQGVVRKKIYQIKADFDLSKILHSAEITSDRQKIGIFCSGNSDGLGIALIRETDFPIDKNSEYILENKVISLKLAEWYS